MVEMIDLVVVIVVVIVVKVCLFLQLAISSHALLHPLTTPRLLPFQICGDERCCHFK